jgi:hypothetical protein
MEKVTPWEADAGAGAAAGAAGAESGASMMVCALAAEARARRNKKPTDVLGMVPASMQERGGDEQPTLG